MKKKLIKIGTGLCVAAAAALILGEMGNVRASMRGSSSGLAGISLYIDQFYDAGSEEPDQMMRSAVPDQKADGEAAGQDQETATHSGEPSEASGETDKPAETDTDTKAPAEEEDEEEELDEEPTSEFENVGVSIANNYVNIRKKPNTESEIVGKLYKGCAATILKRKGEWVKIQSGNAKGYINAEYLAIGFDVDELVDKYGTKWAVVNTETLRVRIDPSTDSKIATLVPQGEELLVLSETDEWVEISIDDGDITGYVSTEFVDIKVEFEHAITIEEEEAEIRRQQEAEEALRQQEEAQRQQQANQNQSTSSNNNNSSQGSSGSSSNSGSNSGSGNKKKNPVSSNNATASIGTSSSSNTGASSNGAQIAAFAQKFVGYPYVYGGTSLTNGADCSGFVQSVYKSFGISIPRDSRSQCAGAGYQVSFDSLQPGDLIFYTNNSGTVNHVAMYIGGGQVVHASDPSSGIKISNMRYRTPYMARRVVN